MRRIGTVAAAVLLFPLTLLGAATSAQAAPALCGSLAGTTPHVKKVLWIFMENTSYGPGAKQIPGNPSANYIDKTLLAQCGSSSDYHALTHPSYPNYVGATTGSTQGAVNDVVNYYDVPNIFGQADPSWRSYEEFMPSNCLHTGQTGNPTTLQYYVSRHNPAASFTALPVGAPTAGDCPQNDEPLGTATSGPLVSDVSAGVLPKFGLITPGLCNDMHPLPTGVSGCPNPVATGDAWLATWIPILTAGPDYASGNLVIDIAWDEGAGGTGGEACLNSSAADCIIPNIVISPYTSHVVSGTDFSHYSLLKTTEALLSLPYLGGAGDPSTIDMCLPFGLCPQDAAVAPTASFTVSCQVASCSFNASGSTAPGSGVTSFAWNFGDGTTGSGQTIQHTFPGQGSYPVSLTVTSQTGRTGTLTQQVTVSSTPPPIGFVAAADVNGNQPAETVTIPASVAPGDGLVLLASGALDQGIAAPAGWTLVGSNDSSGAMVTSVWSKVATAADAGQPVTVTFSSTFRKGNVQLLAYSGTSTSSPVLSFASAAGHATTSTATTPALSVAGAGSWVISGWTAKSSAVNTWTAPGGQVVRDANYGSGSGRIDMIATDGGGPAAPGTVGGLAASTDQPFTADTTLTLVLAPAS